MKESKMSIIISNFSSIPKLEKLHHPPPLIITLPKLEFFHLFPLSFGLVSLQIPPTNILFNHALSIANLIKHEYSPS